MKVSLLFHLCSVLSALCSVLCALCSVLCALCPVHVPCALCPLCSLLCSVLCALCSLLCSVLCALCLCSVLCAMCFVLCALCCPFSSLLCHLFYIECLPGVPARHHLCVAAAHDVPVHQLRRPIRHRLWSHRWDPPHPYRLLQLPEGRVCLSYIAAILPYAFAPLCSPSPVLPS